MATPFGCITMESNNFLRVNAADAAVLGLIEVITLVSKGGKPFNIWRASNISGYTKLSAGVYNSLGAAISVEQRPQSKWFTRNDGTVISCDCILWAASPAEAVDGSVLDTIAAYNKEAQAKLQADSTTVELPED